jgi:NAD(P)-dependent dehydrogenase (short-subunit alcohol dehydrogenase family)
MKKLILITGASSGFGKLTVPLLLQKGHTVVAGLRGGHSRLEELFASELKNYPGQLSAVDLHMEKTSDFSKVSQHLNQFGDKSHPNRLEGRFESQLDVLINNAGYGLMGTLEDQTEEQVRHQMEVNFFGSAFLTQSLLPALRNSKGRILNVSSICGLTSFPFYGTYSASKFALEGLMQGLAFDLAPFGVQVGMIEPGGFKTEFISSRVFGNDAKLSLSAYHERNQAFARVFEKTSGRQGNPLRVAKLIAHLCDSKKVPFRNVIGTDAQAACFLQSVLPTSIYRRLIAFAFNTAMSRA